MTRTRSQIGRASRQKGKRGEREVVALLQSLGYPARRTQQVDGGLSSDVIIEGHAVYIEVKNDKSIRPGNAAWREAIRRADRESNGKYLMFFAKIGRGVWCLTDYLGDMILIGDALRQRILSVMSNTSKVEPTDTCEDQP